jgi:hypothetical protein
MSADTIVIGATAVVQMNHYGCVYPEVYFSFGEYDEVRGSDSFGVKDDDIFFYARGEEEIQFLMNDLIDTNEDFVVLEYQLVSRVSS